jgi:hypothetical protein
METASHSHRVYRYTSIGRPLDPASPSNRAVLILMSVTAIAALVYHLQGGAGLWQACIGAVVFTLVVFGSWALARELMPDDHVAAFVSMGLAVLVAVVTPEPGLLTLFSTLLLVRVVNRSPGLPPRTTDSLLITGLVIWTIYSSASPWFGAVAALAFFLDGVLRKPLKKQWLFSLVCFGSMVVYMVDHDVIWWLVTAPDSLWEWLAVLTLLLFSLNLMLTKKIHTRGDVDNARLDLERVKAGMATGVLATLQGLGNLPQVALLVATIGGLCLGIALRRAFRSPVKGLRAG